MRIGAHHLAQRVADGVDVAQLRRCGDRAGVAAHATSARAARRRRPARAPRSTAAPARPIDASAIGVDLGDRAAAAAPRARASSSTAALVERRSRSARSDRACAPLLEQRRRHVGGARRLLVAAHAERLELDQRRALAARGARSAASPSTRCTASRSLPSHDHARDAVAGARGGEVRRQANCSAHRRRQAVLVVLDRRRCTGSFHTAARFDRLVEVPFAGAAVADERRRHARRRRAAAPPAPRPSATGSIAARWLIMPTM